MRGQKFLVLGLLKVSFRIAWRLFRWILRKRLRRLRGGLRKRSMSVSLGSSFRARGCLGSYRICGVGVDLRIILRLMDVLLPGKDI